MEMENDNAAGEAPVLQKVTFSAVQDSAQKTFGYTIGKRTWVDTARMLLQWIAIGFCLAHVAEEHTTNKSGILSAILGTIIAFVFPMQYAAYLTGGAVYHNCFIDFVMH